MLPRGPSWSSWRRFELIELARQQIELTAPGITHVTANVEFFDKEGARQLIQAYAAAAARPGSHYQQHPESARDFIATYFDAVESTLGLAAGELWQSEQGRVFVGYAPVLAAVGSIMAAIDNFTTVANNLKANGGREAWGVIEAVLYEILSREQDKLRNLLEVQCETTLPNAVYDAEEQMALLAQYVESKPLEGTGRVALPLADMEKYNDMIQTYLPHHPFVRRHEFGNAVLGSPLVTRAVYHGRIDFSRSADKPVATMGSVGANASAVALIVRSMTGPSKVGRWCLPKRICSAKLRLHRSRC